MKVENIETKRVLRKLEKIREEKEMDQGTFARKELGFSRIQYNRWIHGRNSPTKENLARLYSYLKSGDPNSTTVTVQSGSETIFLHSEKDVEGTVSVVESALQD